MVRVRHTFNVCSSETLHDFFLFGDPNCYAIFRNEFMIVSKMVYIDNLDGYEEVYDEVEETPTTTDFIYYDAGKLARFSP